MSRGINIAENTRYNTGNFSYLVKKPVIFLSHKSEDKDFVENIGKYIMNAGLDIYLDKNDVNLQNAYGNPEAVTECIQNGINRSDYILCITSNKTVSSWWVPYEIGYGKKANKEICTLVRKDYVYLPDYLKIEPIIQGIDSLNKWIARIVKQEMNTYITESYNYAINMSEDILQKPSQNHVLYQYLNL